MNQIRLFFQIANYLEFKIGITKTWMYILYVYYLKGFDILQCFLAIYKKVRFWCSFFPPTTFVVSFWNSFYTIYITYHMCDPCIRSRFYVESMYVLRLWFFYSSIPPVASGEHLKKKLCHILSLILNIWNNCIDLWSV